MKIRFESNSNNQGFSLIELIVVLIITAILAQLGFTAFNSYARRTRAFAARTALKNIQRECETNRDLEAPRTFTLIPIKGYSIATIDTNSCYGQSSDGKVAAIADNQNEIPNYFYDFLLGQITCSFSNSSSGIFKSCSGESLSISNWTTYAEETAKLESISPKVVGSSCETKWAGVSRTGRAQHATDGNKSTKWTCDGMASIDFDLGKKKEIRSVNVEFDGDVTNGNYIKIYVDGKVVAEGTQPCCGDGKTWFFEPIEGQRIRYETIEKPHTLNLYGVDRGEDPQLQSASWSEIGELTVNGPYSSRTNKGNSSTSTGIFSGG